MSRKIVACKAFGMKTDGSGPAVSDLGLPMAGWQAVGAPPRGCPSADGLASDARESFAQAPGPAPTGHDDNHPVGATPRGCPSADGLASDACESFAQAPGPAPTGNPPVPRRATGGPVFGATGALFLLALLWVGGCGEPQAAPGPTGRAGQPAETGTREVVDRPPVIRAAGFATARIRILPLTELAEPSDGEAGPILSVYLALLDAFGSQIKAPGILRFELYEYVPRSVDPKGQRIAIWSGIDLTDPAENNTYWRNFLRAYEFKLDVRADTRQTYILEATCICLEGKRLSAEFTLKSGT